MWRRYKALFRKLTEAAAEEEKPALLSQGKRAIGWRGLSVDLITGDEMVGTSTPSPVREGHMAHRRGAASCTGAVDFVRYAV
jgi:hypothetical protein